ncbi:MAG: lipoyl synthase [Candidatus Omnitrophota bacterium]
MTIERKPAWLRKKIVFSREHGTKSLLTNLRLNTVCEEARCPNISECYCQGHATFLIMGKNCTRGCAFCHVTKDRTPEPLDPMEPQRVAEAVRQMKLKHAVITSVTRDDLPDGGAGHFCRVIGEIRGLGAKVTMETLVPDFQGNLQSVRAVSESSPDIFGHNIETVPRLYRLRPQADYKRSLEVLKNAKAFNPVLLTKSALLLGMGETEEEVIQCLKDLRQAECDFLALGQYLRPDKINAEVKEYVTPAAFKKYEETGLALGFLHIESGPYVRSSYNASSYLDCRR